MRAWITTATLGCIALGSCASVMTGKTDEVAIVSIPAGAHFETNTHHAGTTPSTITIPDNIVLEVSFQKAGYEPLDATLPWVGSRWMLGSMLIGLPTLFGDLVILDYWQTHPDSLAVELVPTAQAGQ